MLPKKNRADKKAIDEIFKKGLFLGTKNLNIKYTLKNKDILPKISVIVSKKIEKTAIKRNSLRRRVYSLLKGYTDKLPQGFSGAIMLNSNKLTLLELKEELGSLLSKIK